MLSVEERAELLRAAEKVQQAAARHLSANPNKQYAITFVANLQRGVDSVMHTATDQGLHVDCKAGCSYCCHVRVQALDPEIFRIARELRKYSPEELQLLLARLQSHATVVKGVSIADHRTACPFLEDNMCSIYEVRPAVCRKAHSLDVEKCKLPGEDIPQSLDVILKAEALMKGTTDAYRQVDLSATGHELGQAVLLALTDETAESRWYAGEAIFDELK